MKLTIVLLAWLGVGFLAGAAPPPVEAPKPTEIIAATVPGGWTVELWDDDPYSVCRWVVVYRGRRVYGRYNDPAMAKAVARELARRGYGRRFPATNTEDDEISEAAFRVTPRPSIEEERRWWAERSARP